MPDATPEDPARTPVEALPGVGPRRAQLLARLGLKTLRDLVFHFPSRYYDRRRCVPLGKLPAKAAVTVQGTVTGVRSYRSARQGIPVLEVHLADPSGRAVLVWFGQPYRAGEFRIGDVVVAAGRAAPDGRPHVTVEEFEVLEQGREARHAAGLVPGYPATEGLGKRFLRGLVGRAVERAADRVPETLPEELRVRRGLPGIAEALRGIHRPASPEEAERARRRFAYEEFFALQLRLALARRRVARFPGRPLPVSAAMDFRIRRLFPFKLTGAQERAVQEIRRDLAAGPPMNRLLQGDVGSGKTVIAAYALLAAVGNRAQGALLAPTEVLAEQHARVFGELLARSRVRVALLVGGVPARRRAELLGRIAAGDVDLVIGTHALLEDNVRFRDLALVVIDEQQKFGVLQRAALARKGTRPHLLVMTATPIPRTLALALYGDLDVTVLDERPPGRREVVTLYVPPAGRRAKYAFIRRQLAEGRQAYFVCPRIGESGREDLSSAVRMAEEVRREFPEFAAALLHGRMRPEEKQAAMEAFRSGRARILVSTIVIEVGVDVPNASIMVIDRCERFGLSQLHQLRGRIGRGPHPSYCILFGGRNERIDAFVSTTDGFRIAEADLRLRGAGEMLGTRQSGLPEFRAARLAEDVPILEAARADAFAWVERDPALVGLPPGADRGPATADAEALLGAG